MMFDYAFIDFDNTIYESHILGDEIKRIFLSQGVSEVDFQLARERAIHGINGEFYNYTFELHLSLLKDAGYRFDDEHVLKQLHNIFAVSLQSSDAEDFLHFMKMKSEKLVLLTAGNQEFQRKKLSSTNLVHFFDDIHILHEAKEQYVASVNHQTQKNIFINDNLKQNCAIRDLFPNMTVITRRHPRKYTDADMEKTGIPYFHTLNEIKTYIERM